MSIKFVLRDNELILWEHGSEFLCKPRNMSYLSRRIKKGEDGLLNDWFNYRS